MIGKTRSRPRFHKQGCTDFTKICDPGWQKSIEMRSHRY